MKWVLIITIFNFKGAQVETVEFSSQQLCVIAGNSYLNATQKSLNNWQQSVKTLCVQKDEK